MKHSYFCEVCAAPLVYHGGPHEPRWCADHREAGDRLAKRSAEHSHDRALGSSGRCEGCEAHLLRRSDDGLCGFCQVELGVLAERELWVAVAA